MTDTIISVENLGKRYSIRHQRNERYTTLRDTIAAKFSSAFRAPRSTIRNSSVEDFWALRNVSFEVKRGEVLGIIGRNGAGKTTLLKILSRITDPTEGRVHIRGRVASLLEVGTGFHPELTGRENIFLNGAILGMSRAEIRAKFDEIVTFAETEKFLDTPVKRYSSGMYVRLAFAVAAHLEPEILVIDEVLAVGDAEFQKKCLGKMESASRQQGRTILFVSHNLQAITRLCSRAIVLQSGGVIYEGDAASAVAAYVSKPEHNDVWRYDTRTMRRSISGSGLARIEEVSFPRRSAHLPFGGAFKSRIRISAERHLSGLCFDITFFGLDNNPIGTSFSLEPIELRGGQSVEYELTIPELRLAPGVYICDVALLKGNWLRSASIHDVVSSVLKFHVDPPVDANGTQAVWQSGWGYIVPDEILVGPVADSQNS